MSGECEVGDPVASCPEEEPRIISARWLETPVKCGNGALMWATTENIPDDTPATFTVKRTSDSGTITTENEPVAWDSILKEWVSQKTSDNWNGPEVTFTVAAAGLQRDSENELEFHRYANIPRAAYDRHISVPVPGSSPTRNFAWDRRVKVELDDRVLIIHVPIEISDRGPLLERNKNESDADYTARCNRDAPRRNLSAGEKSSLKTAIENVFNPMKALHRRECRRTRSCSCRTQRKCCKLEIRVQVHFYDRGDTGHGGHFSSVSYWRGNGRANSANWYSSAYPATTWVFAHEVGHLMGFYDEYSSGAVNPAGAPWQSAPDYSLHNLMNGDGRLENYYFNEYADWLRSGTSEEWDVVGY